METTSKIGDLRVWHIPQVPGKVFQVPVNSVAEGVKIMAVLADYDDFQFRNNIKPDYCNAQGLEIYEADNGDGGPGWSSWYDEESGEDDPEQYLQDNGLFSGDPAEWDAAN